MKEQDMMQTSMREIVEGYLRKIGVPEQLDGFKYLTIAVFMAVETPDLLTDNSKVIYHGLAELFSKTYKTVEKGIRIAVEAVFDSSENANVIDDYFGNTISIEKGKATNLEFIAAIKEQIIEEPESKKLAAKHLRTIGIPIRSKGYEYLKLAIGLALEDRNMIELGAQNMYFKLAEMFCQKPSAVERIIRDAIQKAYGGRGDLQVLCKYFGDSAPTNFQFVKCVAERIIEEEEN